jgi:hypothetical protein
MNLALRQRRRALAAGSLALATVVAAITTVRLACRPTPQWSTST